MAGNVQNIKVCSPLQLSCNLQENATRWCAIISRSLKLELNHTIKSCGSGDPLDMIITDKKNNNDLQ